ncbi:putative phospholipid-binding protein MlaC precursor [bacterium BMS3Bbin06]|nr:putative phospholipid-binding protein MlaC precursor [bacterium BMS3Abin08]GBE34233.1 putative phospholipid-binding protein MlaC precursor [bacterium BMS3Bbin06]HDO36907.1 ABC transporter substrate-binding protein [Nitrospirota bacterium]HDY71986.1 ABC transporter substrate-binding protein [Nitrospirota bacterium]
MLKFNVLTLRSRNQRDCSGTRIPVLGSAVYIFLLASILFILCAGPAEAGAPLEQIKGTVDKVLEILRDKSFKKPGMEELRRKKLRETIEARFNFEEIGRRALGLYWRKRTPDERKEFTALFSRIIEKAYIKKIEAYSDEKIVYTDENIDDGYATVRTKIITAVNTEIPIEYRLLSKEGRWEVYDVVIEGVSLVNNYRMQFSSILHSKPYAYLVKVMKAKVAKKD